MREAGGLVLGLALLIAAGRGLLLLLCPRPVPLPAPARLALTLLAGVAAEAFLVTSCGAAGLPVRPWPLVGPLLVLLALAPVPLRRGGSRVDGGRVWPTLLAALATVPVLAVAAVQRTVLNDEYAIWSLKARILTAAGHVDVRLFARDPAYLYSHRDYPLLLPSLQVWTTGWAGRESDRLTHLVVALVVAAGLVLVAGLVQRTAGVVSAAAAVLLLPATRGLPLQATWQLADAALAVCALGLLLVLGRVAVEDDAGPWLAAAVPLAAAMVMTKNEGTVFLLAAVLGLAVAAPAGRRRRALVPLAAGVLGALPWSVWTRAHGLENDFVNSSTLRPSSLADHADRLRPLLSAVGHYWTGPPAVSCAVLAVVLALVLHAVPDSRRPLAVLLVGGALSTAGLLLTYLLAEETGPAFFRSNLPRVLLLPGAVVWVAGAVAVPALLRAGGWASWRSTPAVPTSSASSPRTPAVPS